MPPQLAQALNTLQDSLNHRNGTQIEVKSIMEVFGRGVKDEEWIPKIAGQVVITQDFRIQTTRHQRDLLHANKVGVVFIKSSKNGLLFWEMTKLLINRWEEILKIIRQEKTPFAFVGTQRSKFQKFD